MYDRIMDRIPRFSQIHVNCQTSSTSIDLKKYLLLENFQSDLK